MEEYRLLVRELVGEKRSQAILGAHLESIPLPRLDVAHPLRLELRVDRCDLTHDGTS